MKVRHKRLLVGALLVCFAGVMACSVLSSLDAGEKRSYAASGRRAEISARIEVPSGTVDVNGGDLEEIMLLPRVGEKIGQAVIDERELNGPYYYPEDLLAVRGIGEKTLAGFRDMLKLTMEE